MYIKKKEKIINYINLFIYNLDKIEKQNYVFFYIISNIVIKCLLFSLISPIHIFHLSPFCLLLLPFSYHFILERGFKTFKLN